MAAATAACGSREGSPTPVLFFAAASTQDAVREICSRFETRNQVPVNLNIAASSTLAQQILAGAGSDLFLSANVRWVEEIMTQGLGSRRRDLLGNRLVVIAPSRERSPDPKTLRPAGFENRPAESGRSRGRPGGDLCPAGTAEAQPVAVSRTQGGA